MINFALNLGRILAVTKSFSPVFDISHSTFLASLYLIILSSFSHLSLIFPYIPLFYIIGLHYSYTLIINIE